jgi:hypothetical protein
MLYFALPLLLVLGIFVVSKAAISLYEEWQLEKSNRKKCDQDTGEN